MFKWKCCRCMQTMLDTNSMRFIESSVVPGWSVWCSVTLRWSGLSLPGLASWLGCTLGGDPGLDGILTHLNRGEQVPTHLDRDEQSG